MENAKVKPSALLTVSGTVMIMSGVLMGISVSFAYAGILWAAASCDFLAAYHIKSEVIEYE